MSEKSKARIHLEYEGKIFDMEGTVEEIFEAVNKWLAQFAPAISALSSIIYTPDVDQLAKAMSNIGIISPPNVALLPELKPSTAEAICLSLALACLGKQIGQLNKASLAKDEIASFSGKDVDDISKRISDLKRLGLIEPISKDEFQITALGIKQVIEKIAPKVKVVVE